MANTNPWDKSTSAAPQGWGQKPVNKSPWVAAEGSPKKKMSQKPQMPAEPEKATEPEQTPKVEQDKLDVVPENKKDKANVEPLPESRPVVGQKEKKPAKKSKVLPILLVGILIVAAMIATLIFLLGGNSETPSTELETTPTEMTEPSLSEKDEEVTSPEETKPTEAPTEAPTEEPLPVVEDYDIYAGNWTTSEDENFSLFLLPTAKGVAGFELTISYSEASYSYQVATAEIGFPQYDIVNNTITRTYKDSFGNSGTVTLLFKKDSILCTISDTSNSGQWGFVDKSYLLTEQEVYLKEYDFEGLWANEGISYSSGGTTLEVSFEQDFVKLHMINTQSAPACRVAEADFEAKIVDIDEGVFYARFSDDGWGNSGTVKFRFAEASDGDVIVVEFVEIISSATASWGLYHAEPIVLYYNSSAYEELYDRNTADYSNSYYYNDANTYYTANQIAVNPRYVYWENGYLIAECFVINGYAQSVCNINLQNLAVNNSDGCVAEGAFGYLNGLTLQPYTYAVWTFRFGPEAIQNLHSDLSYVFTTSYCECSYAY